MTARTHALYRFWSASDELLYIGISADPGRRWKQHRSAKSWWDEVATVTLQTYPTREEVIEAERWAIAQEHPRYNVIHAKADWTRDVRTGPTTWGARAEDMPDDCHDHCARSGLASIYYPHLWIKGIAHYVCSEGHTWTCGWGHLNSGDDPYRRGVPVEQHRFDLATLARLP